ncbi:hypothetical protein GCM10009661_29510 [Catellatospora chokoriensis]|uniref:HTH cro/C1-type domain-containing protein n=2 Tax=Catellatospora chokoriensis TaxID=310353 RepID=A0A8J3JZS3_9ACTN|nr:hypothetical protein Cch02nite_32860 [Catellatospora chokoriensis]
MDSTAPLTVVLWTGVEARVLRAAKRMSVRAFAEHLGVAARTVSYWESEGRQITPRPDMQAILDRALESATTEVRRRFALLAPDAE